MKAARRTAPTRKRLPCTTRVAPRPLSTEPVASTATLVLHRLQQPRTSQNEMNVSITMNINEPAVPWPRWKSSNPCW